eukprot:TRINITY_DN25287_c0_g2_i1.p2 TRINITY_DN25287_c0_g2~~TRINITY_DN25287_c0_g2_i1.p2  ORF type:complete len:208 (+),score=-18.06 TRINITY_DN25287_c0_g2_i1:685-1308(+)
MHSVGNFYFFVLVKKKILILQQILNVICVFVVLYQRGIYYLWYQIKIRDFGNITESLLDFTEILGFWYQNFRLMTIFTIFQVQDVLFQENCLSLVPFIQPILQIVFTYNTTQYLYLFVVNYSYTPKNYYVISVKLGVLRHELVYVQFLVFVFCVLKIKKVKMSCQYQRQNMQYHYSCIFCMISQKRDVINIYIQYSIYIPLPQRLNY